MNAPSKELSVRKIESIADIQFDTTIDNTFSNVLWLARFVRVDSRIFNVENVLGLSADAATHFDDCILFPEIDFS